MNGKKSLFDAGRVVATPDALSLLSEKAIEPSNLLRRHLSGDWGDICEEDKQLNDQAVVDGDRILSSYTVGNDDEKVWVISEWDRSATTILLPENY